MVIENGTSSFRLTMSRPSPYHHNFLLCPQETKTSSSDWSNCSVKCPHNVMSCRHFRFRRGFKQFFRCCPFVHVGPEVLTRREVVTSRYSCTGSPDHHRIVRNGKSTQKKKFQFLAEFEALMTKVSDFLPFSPQIPSARSFIRVRGRRRVIVNHMVSIIAWIYFVHTSRRLKAFAFLLFFAVATESFLLTQFLMSMSRNRKFL